MSFKPTNHPPTSQSLLNVQAGDVLREELRCLDPIWALTPSEEGCRQSCQGKGDARQKDIITVLFSVFLFAQKQSIYSSVLQHKYIRKELYYILLGTKKKKNVMKAELTDFLHLLYALTSL